MVSAEPQAEAEARRDADACDLDDDGVSTALLELADAGGADVDSAEDDSSENGGDEGATVILPPPASHSRHVVKIPPLPPTRPGDDLASTYPGEGDGGGQLWAVVGGRLTRGLVVRRGRRLSSDELRSRLAYGARVMELQRRGDRLKYWKVRGEGPSIGWVSMEFKGSPLLVEVDYDQCFTQKELHFQQNLMLFAPRRPTVTRVGGTNSRLDGTGKFVWMKAMHFRATFNPRAHLPGDMTVDDVFRGITGKGILQAEDLDGDTSGFVSGSAKEVENEEDAEPFVIRDITKAPRALRLEVASLSADCFGIDVASGSFKACRNGEVEAAGLFAGEGEALVGFIFFSPPKNAAAAPGDKSTAKHFVDMYAKWREEHPAASVMHVHHVAVQGVYRCRGYGRKLLEYVRARCLERGIEELEAECRFHNLRYYLGLGWLVLEKDVRNRTSLPSEQTMWHIKLDAKEEMIDWRRHSA